MKIQYHLEPQFEGFLKNKQWNQYISLLCDKGLFWWLNFDAIKIVDHLNPFAEFPPTVQKPDRLVLLQKVLNPNTSQEEFIKLYHRFYRQKDQLAVVASIIGGWSNVWNSGIDLMQMEAWMNEIQKIKKAGIQLTAIEQAAVLTAAGSIEMMHRGNINNVGHTFRKALFLAEKAKAFSLKLYIAYIYGHSLIWRGDLKRMEVLDFDIAPLCRNEEMALIPVIAYQTMKSFFYLLLGEVSQSKDLLHKIIEHELFDFSPPSIWLLAYGNLLLANAYDGNVDEVRRISKIIQNRAVPEQNNFHHGYAHFSLGTAALVTGDLYKAKLHTEEGIKRARICNAPIIERICSLLMGQLLIDSGDYENAGGLLKKWIHRWRAKGNLLLAGQGALELAHLHCQIENQPVARNYFQQASDLLPQFDSIPNPHRGAAFTDTLKQKIVDNNVFGCASLRKGDAKIEIRTFGNLKIQAGNQIIFDNGRKNLALSMLKAILSSGGKQVSASWLMDALWPHLEGDRAYSAFKVTLFRLRRMVCAPKQKPPPWIKLKDKKLSFSESLCSVDSIVFQDKIKTIGSAINDIQEQAAVLDLYQTDFLNDDDEHPWILHHRSQLRQFFMEGAMAMAEHCLQFDNPKRALPYLKKAVELENINEKVYALLMKAYLTMGLPSQALDTYKTAKTNLNHHLQSQPGNPLTQLKEEAATHSQ